MKSIFKYKLPSDGCIITIQEKVIKWLDVRSQGNWPHIWAIVETDIVEPVEIIAWGTGWDVSQELMEWNYLGTESDYYGYVWHYFYKKVETDNEKTYINNEIDDNSTIVNLDLSIDSPIDKSINNITISQPFFSLNELTSLEECGDYQVYGSIGSVDIKRGLSASLTGTVSLEQHK